MDHAGFLKKIEYSGGLSELNLKRKVNGVLNVQKLEQLGF